MLSLVTAILLAFSVNVLAAPSPTIPQTLQERDPWANDPFVRRDADAPPFEKRAASCTFPSPPRTSTISSPITVTGTFDGGNVRFDRGSGACEDGEGGDADAVFLIQNGGTLQ